MPLDRILTAYRQLSSLASASDPIVPQGSGGVQDLLGTSQNADEILKGKIRDWGPGSCVDFPHGRLPTTSESTRPYGPAWFAGDRRLVQCCTTDLTPRVAIRPSPMCVRTCHT
jgi:hypothetical protein